MAAANIRAIRKKRDLSVAELSARCGLSRNIIENIEGGRPDRGGNRIRRITVDELLVIAEGLGVPLVDLWPAAAGQPVILVRAQVERLADDARELHKRLRTASRQLDGSASFAELVSALAHALLADLPEEAS